MKTKHLFEIITLSLFLFTLMPVSGSAQVANSTLNLDELIQKVLARNPQLQYSYEDWKASNTRISQQKALPDPTLGLNMMNLPINSFALDQEPMTGKQLSLMQAFPFPGILNLKGKIAESDSKINRYRHRELKNQLIKQTKQAYYDLYYIDQALRTVTENQELLRKFVEIAETRYGVGKGLQQDVLRAQVTLSKMLDRELKLQQKRTATQAKINILINIPADAPLGIPTAPPMSTLSTTLRELTQRADSTNPMLAAWETTVEKSDQQIDLAHKNRYPDFSVGIAYTQRDDLQSGMKGYDFVSAMVNLKLPLFHKKKQAQKVQEKRITKSAIEYRYQNITNTVEQKLQQSLSNLNKSRRLIELYKTGIIPQAEESLESSLAGYQNNKVDFLSLLDSELTLFQYQLDYHRFLADYHKTVAELEALIGTGL
ncbi:TolC family protein [Fodinibius saliphilus]|uniref:TolC family protein n=1 Tax=Fodinibius saliphilus TaxID=1920650 RepID=UPI001109F090|nr:TolC family protein [Fodinibius saliphilus]